MFLARVIQSPTPAERQVLASQRTRTCCLRRNGTSRPLRRHGFRGSILHPMHSLCTLHLSRRRLTCNTHYWAGATPYPGGTFTRWNTPAFPGAPVFPSRPYRSTDTAHSGGQGWPKAIAKDAALTAASTGPLWPRRPSQTLRKKGLIKTNTLTSRLHERIRPVCSSQRPLITAMWHMEAPRASLLTPRRASAIFDQPLRLTGLPSEGSSWLLFKGGTYARGIYTDGELEEGAGRSRRVRCQLSLWPADIAWNVGAGRHTTDPACARRYGSDGRDHANQAFERGATCPHESR